MAGFVPPSRSLRTHAARPSDAAIDIGAFEFGSGAPPGPGGVGGSGSGPGATGDGAADASGGCGCKLAPTPGGSGPPAIAWWLGAALAVAARRRR